MQILTSSIIISPGELGSLFTPTILRLSSPRRVDRSQAAKLLWDFVRKGSLLSPKEGYKAEPLCVTVGSSINGAERLVLTFQWVEEIPR
jgi:hypothetical protein